MFVRSDLPDVRLRIVMVAWSPTDPGPTTHPTTVFPENPESDLTLSGLSVIKENIHLKMPDDFE